VTVVAECSGRRPTLSRTIAAPGSITRPNHDGGGGGGGEKNRHTPSSYRRRTAILPDCTNSRGGVLNVVHCRCVSVGGGGVHPSNDQKDNDESGRCGGTVMQSNSQHMVRANG
jgi:hypothetical protein